MISVTIGTVTKTAEEALSGGWIHDQIERRRRAGALACVEISIKVGHDIDVRLVADATLEPMMRLTDSGLFEIQTSGPEIPDYRLRITFWNGHVLEIDDPYRYGRVLTDFDLHLLGEGTHHRAFEKLGAHRITVGTTTGVHFAV